MRSLNNPLLQAVTDGIAVLDHELKLQFVNRAFEVITGINADICNGKNISIIGTADTGIKAGQLCLDAVLENRVVYGDLEFSGQKISVQVFPGREGCQLLLRQNAATQAPEKLTHDTGLLQRILQNMPSSFVFIDTQFRVQAWSDHFKTIVEHSTGKKLEAGGNVFRYMSDRDEPKLRERMEKALSGDMLEMECTFHLPLVDRVVWARQYFHPVYGEAHELLGLAYHGFNMDAKKQAETELEESYKRLNQVMKATNDAVWEWNMHSNALKWNENFYNLFGYAREDVELNFKWWDENVHPDDRDRVMDQLNAVLDAKGTRCQCDYRFRCRNGSYKYVHDSCFIEYNERGEAWRMVGSMQDIDYLKIQEQQLMQQNQTLHNLAFVQSHLIRKPAANIIALQNVMRGYLCEELKKNPELQLLFNHMEESVTELDAMIHASVSKIHELDLGDGSDHSGQQGSFK